METVRCEELQLELSAALKSRSARSTVATMSGQSTVTWAPTPTQHQSITHHSTSSSVVQQPSSSRIDSHHVSMSQNQQSSHQHQQSGSEIDRIMAKIEQARLSLANVCVIQQQKQTKHEQHRLYPKIYPKFLVHCCNVPIAKKTQSN